MNKYKYWLHRLPLVGDVTIHKLLKHYGDACNIYNACINSDDFFIKVMTSKDHSGSEFRLERVLEMTGYYDLDSEYRKLEEKDIQFITMDDPEYPTRLFDIPTPPYAIYVKGSVPENDIPAIAIIGSRECSEYGKLVAKTFGEALASAGINIISGMARGVDGISQQGALDAGGNTYAVLGSGVDVCYPAGNFKLYREIQQKGGVISTFPPGSAAEKKKFPERNKIIAALADFVLVIEARKKSGTLITVDHALKLNRDVYAVPGRITDNLSSGCNSLIRDGAGIVLSPQDILRDIAVLWGRINPDSDTAIPLNIRMVNSISPDGQEEAPRIEKGSLLSCLDLKPQNAESIYRRYLEINSEATLQETINELVLLCIEGRAIQIGSGFFYRTL